MAPPLLNLLAAPPLNPISYTLFIKNQYFLDQLFLISISIVPTTHSLKFLLAAANTAASCTLIKQDPHHTRLYVTRAASDDQETAVAL